MKTLPSFIGFILFHCLSTHAQNNCESITYPGAICCDDTICVGTPPSLIYQTIAPEGGNGALEFVWDVYDSAQMPSTWVPIPNANEMNYQPDTLPIGRFFFIRAVRRDSCPPYMYSNFTTIVVLPDSDPRCTATSLVVEGDEPSFPAILSENPFVDRLLIHNILQERLEATVFDLYGKLLNYNVIPAGEEIEIGSTWTRNGLYFLLVKSNTGQVWVKKLVKS